MHQASELVQIHQPVAVLIVRLQHTLGFSIVHIDVQTTQGHAELLVIELAAVVRVVPTERRADLRVAHAAATGAVAWRRSLELTYQTSELVQIHQPVAVLVVRLQDAGRLRVVHIDAQTTQGHAELLVIELAAVVRVVPTERRADLRVAHAAATAAERRRRRQRRRGAALLQLTHQPREL